MSQRVPESERVSQSGPDRARERARREPESELEGLKVSLRVTLGPNLGCQSQPRQSELENNNFPAFFLRFLFKKQFYDVFLRVRVTKYCKLQLYLHGEAHTEARSASTVPYRFWPLEPLQCKH